MLNKTKNLIPCALFIIILATILNGTSFWLKKVGWLEKQELLKLQNEVQLISQQVGNLLNTKESINEEDFLNLRVHYKKQKKRLAEFLYSTPNAYIYLKLLKYFSIIILIIACLINRTSGHVNDTLLLHRFFWGFCLIILISAILNIEKNSWQHLLAGIYTFVFIVVALASRGVIKLNHMRFFANLLIGSIVLLFLLLPIEISQSIQLFQNDSLLQKRLSGFMIQPSTMGVYIVCVSAFVLSHYGNKLNLTGSILFLLLISIAIQATGSNTAILALPVIVYFQLNRLFTDLSLRKKLVLILVLILITLFMLNSVGRLHLYSIMGRFAKLQYYLGTDIPLLNLIFGQGLGVGTNSILQINTIFQISTHTNEILSFSADSTILLLILQTGLLGCGLFYLLLIVAAIRSDRYRLTYTIIILCSLTINIIEVFPINILIGLMLPLSFYNKVSDEKVTHSNF